MTPKRILRSIRRIMRSTGQYSRQIATEYGVTVPQMLCLQLVVENDGLSAGELAKGMDLTQSTCVGILDRLEAKGLVKRERSIADRRMVLLHPTETGRELYQRAPILLQDRLTRALESLSEPEQEAIAVAMERVVEMMDLGHVDAAPLLETLDDLHTEPESEAVRGNTG